jgi:hypothetical protein
MVAWHVADGSGAAILEMRPCERLQISAHKGTNMPMRGELSMPRLERHSVRLGNKEFLLIATFCILGLTVSIFIAVVCQASEPANNMLAVQAPG